MPTNVIMPALELAQIHMLRRNEFAPLRTRMGHVWTAPLRQVLSWHGG
jgi:hypothetical protein